MSLTKLKDGLLSLDPRKSKTVRVPPLKEKGSWVGAPSVIFDDSQEKFFLYYRLRNPRNKPMKSINYHRGYEARIAESDDGVIFNDIWALSKQEYNALSFERACLRKVNDKFHLYLSYNDINDETWKIDLLKASDPSNFDYNQKKTVLTPKNKGKLVDHVKDPYLIKYDGQWIMFVNYHDQSVSKVSETGVAISENGNEFSWSKKDLFPQERNGWDKEIARFTTLIKTEKKGKALMFYDCGSLMSEMVREEKTALGILDLADLKVKRLKDKRLPLESPHSSASLRYVDSFKRKGIVRLYYEFATRFATHELRTQEFHIKDY